MNHPTLGIWRVVGGVAKHPSPNAPFSYPKSQGSLTCRNVEQDTSGSIDESVCDFVEVGLVIRRGDNLVW